MHKYDYKNEKTRKAFKMFNSRGQFDAYFGKWQSVNCTLHLLDSTQVWQILTYFQPLSLLVK
jgi:hypothetical protein